ncbi:hypothetical protein [Pedobacter sandarakinus]|uniref:hypothetical protein n=1 Tax=Pedobacter sandarakinus TaxID=353156 RepID=UPI002246B855|nr:hypothetical protein [Pedobacter sandarakinus]MCX2573658.1 hypothetical protein [Pedobacter sandarakinus]
MAALASLILVYKLVKQRKKEVVTDPTALYTVLNPYIRLHISNVDNLGYDPDILNDIEISYSQLKQVDQHLGTNYKDLMHLQLHLDSGKSLGDFDISEELYKELILEVDYFFMARLAAPSPNDDAIYYLPKSLEDQLIGYH